MIVRLGYACISETVNAVTSSTYTYTNYKKEHDDIKLCEIVKSNLNALLEILKYNAKNNIHFYRLSSKLIPLATHKAVNFDYLDGFSVYYKSLSTLIKKYDMRIDFHPDQFCVINSVNKDVYDNSLEILKYHYNILEKLNITNKVLVLHVGSSTFGKFNSLRRFINNFNKLDDNIKKSIVIENDDKVFNISDCLYISSEIGIPIVLDYHHHICNGEGIELFDYIDDIFKTWKNNNPKVHFSSPKNNTKKYFRAHHDYIDSDTFIDFIEKIKYLDYDIDIMIEAKKKDEALFRLIRELKYKTNYKFIDETSFIP